MQLQSLSSRTADTSQFVKIFSNASLKSSRRIAGRRHRLHAFASAEAARSLAEAKKKFDANDRMGALNLWEESLKQDPDDAQRLAALYNATCVHAGFGDVELAQITLREAVQRGLDFSKATQDPASVDPYMVKFVASQQVLVRLRKFDEATRKAMGATPAPPTYSPSKPRGSKPSMLDDDLSKVLETDMQGIDTSIFGIIRRVALLLIVLSAMGVGMYVVGIKYLFPDM